MTFEEFMSHVRDHFEDGWDADWEIGDLLALAKEVYQGDEKFDRAAASELGCSANWVRTLIKTAKAFPVETRAADMSWEIHRICACTKDPSMWLHLAVHGGEEHLPDSSTRYHQWSVADLRDAIAAAKETGPAKDEAQAEADTIIRKIKAFAEKWRFTLASGQGFARIQATVHELVACWPCSQ